MKYEIKAEFIILSNSMGLKTGHLCILKGIMGQEYIQNGETNQKLSRNTLSTLVVNKNDHEQTLKKIKTGCKINISGKINVLKNSQPTIEIENIHIIQSQEMIINS